MLELRYNTNTKEVTGWSGDPNQFGNLKDRGNEVILILNIPIPPKSCSAYLFDDVNQALIDNPSYNGGT